MLDYLNHKLENRCIIDSRCEAAVDMIKTNLLCGPIAVWDAAWNIDNLVSEL